MRLSKLFGKTLRQPPTEAEIASHQLLLRAGLAQQLVAGVYSFLPLGWRVLRRIEEIVREEMDASGAQEVFLPTLHPIEIWEQSGRRQAFGETLFVLKDRRDREIALGPTHEEVITDLVHRNVQSYRDLPVTLYQIQTKFRDEARPRAGLIRVREFTMKDAYSFDTDWDGLDVSYDKMVVAYNNIFRRCGVPSVAVEADSGAIGGKDSQEFMYLTDIGEDEIVFCEQCGYAANVEKAAFAKRPADVEEQAEIEEIDTPGMKTIEELAAFLRVEPWRTVKAVFYSADDHPVFVAIRGDLEVNEVKLKNSLKVGDMRLMTDEEVSRYGLVAGSASPVGLEGMMIVADDSVPVSPNLIGGANVPDRHLRNINYGRDWTADLVIDMAKAQEGAPCSRCGSPLAMRRGIEVGHVFKLGTLYSENFGALYLDSDGTEKPCVMGCYGIGPSRLMATVIEANHDERGITWPVTIAPYQVHLVGLNLDRAEVRTAAEQLYEDLNAAGLSVLFDDREESAGVKFNDADLLGMPVRVTVSPRNLANNAIELKARRAAAAETVPLAEALDQVRALLAQLSQ